MLHIALYLQYTLILTKISLYESHTSVWIFTIQKVVYWAQDGCVLLLQHTAGYLQHTPEYLFKLIFSS